MNDFIYPLIIGFFLDFIFGDPESKFHPIRLIGKISTFFEKIFYKKTENSAKMKLYGLFYLISCILAVYFLISLVINIFETPYYRIFILSLLVYFGISNKELITRAKSIESKLSCNDIETARKELSLIVGRDTNRFDENQIRKAVIETTSENLCDGVIAPLFYYFLGGILPMYIYKTVNTLDSMVGYKNEKYKDFGYFSAKMDDLLNFIPARLTALLIYVVTLRDDVLKSVKKFARAHTSPNSGYPEAAIAGFLNCQLGGVNYYNNIKIDKGTIGNNDRIILKKDILDVCSINMKVTVLFVIIITVFRLNLYE